MDSFVEVKTAEARFRLQRRGTGAAAVVFIHGFGGDLADWDRIWALLPADFPALRYDLRGFGQSVAGRGGEFSHSDDLLDILDHLKIERCHLVGVSMGGAIAVNFALNYPLRANRLALISPALVAWEWSEDWKNLWRSIVAEARGGNMDRARQLWWQHPLFASTRESCAAEELRASILRFAGRQWVQDSQRPELADVERLHQLASPVLLLTGERDLEDFRLIADLLEAAVPHLVRVEFPAGGHCLHLEDPAGIVRHLLSFLESEL